MESNSRRFAHQLLIEQSRKMTPQERIIAFINLSKTYAAVHAAGQNNVMTHQRKSNRGEEEKE